MKWYGACVSYDSVSSSNEGNHYDLVVVGGGIVGLATAREVATRYPNMKIAVAEKENDVGKISFIYTFFSSLYTPSVYVCLSFRLVFLPSFPSLFSPSSSSLLVSPPSPSLHLPPALHQSGHNSGVLHTGIYYTSGSLKARLCVRGIKMAYEYCDKKRIPYKKCGKVYISHTLQLYVIRYVCMYMCDVSA